MACRLIGTMPFLDQMLRYFQRDHCHEILVNYVFKKEDFYTWSANKKDGILLRLRLFN